nr:sodium-coupled neutral amino acid transporter 9 homolog isoform X2 [Lytechinus pictus]
MSFRSGTPRDNETGEKAPLLNGTEGRKGSVSLLRESPISGSSNLSGASLTGTEKKRRKPFHHTSRSSISQQGNIQAQEPEEERVAATYQRYRYYSRLGQNNTDHFRIPDHVLPSDLFLLIVPFNLVKKDPGAKQSSIITIFSIWNTMMGTSLLSMPWALQQAGFAMGLVLMLTMAALAMYTCYRVIQSVERLESSGKLIEFSDVCRDYLGRWGEYISVFFSLSALLGAMIVYWVLMSNFLYSTVTFIFEEIKNVAPTSNGTNHCPGYPSVLCPGHHINDTGYLTLGEIEDKPSNFTPSEVILFHKVWTETGTVPLFLCILIIPLIHIKSPTFFTKFNSLGTLSVAFLLVYICVTASHWKINVNFDSSDHQNYVELFSWNFPALSGMLALGFFIHNCVSSILRNQSRPENNGRDLTIAYCLVAGTYTFVAVIFYITFPCQKFCISDNFLKNFKQGDVFAFTARLFLLFQMVTLFPLLVYITRVQLMDQLFGNAYPSWKHMVVYNLILVCICCLFAIFMPHIGKIIRYSGAFCGMAYVFTLPVVVYLLYTKRQGNLRWYHIAFHSLFVVVGVANFISQFLVED